MVEPERLEGAGLAKKQSTYFFRIWLYFLKRATILYVPIQQRYFLVMFQAGYSFSQEERREIVLARVLERERQDIVHLLTLHNQ
ncbi:hypothetical protein EPA93_03435 [Ktedonosporobacter rubrisoli]|uniref:Uncharacterized protein n=1 Tax=Ktedonosporobacter rubrisoli TaxID=2509675 RepID=A0A4P6JKD4_KTERU|nr:hypothetical protein [Ktedonosporobacter rubrisoli]QBD75096.1 hypothetical protein EPA93_03435 [Ktedonosporobacter rubrisoli]